MSMDGLCLDYIMCKGMDPWEEDQSNSDDDVSSNRLLADEDIFRHLKRRSKKGRKKSKKKKKSKEVSEKLGEANVLFVKREYEKAIESLKNVLLVNPDIPEAYQTLGLIYEEIGDEKKAIGCCSIAARFNPSLEKWVFLAERALQCKMNKKAILFLSKAININPGDNKMIWTRSMLLVDLKRYDCALRGLLVLLKREASNKAFIEEFYNVSLTVQPSNETIKAFDSILDANRSELSFLHLKVLMNLWKEKKSHEKIVESFRKYSDVIVSNEFSRDGMVITTTEQREKKIPAELRVLYSSCLVKTRDVSNAVKEIETMERIGLSYQETLEPIRLLVEGCFEEEALLLLDEMEPMVGVLILKAKCYHQLSFLLKAKEVYSAVLQIDQANEEASVGLGRVLVNLGDVSGAVSVVFDSRSNAIEKKELVSVDLNPRSELNTFGELVRERKTRNARSSLFINEADVRLKYEKALVYESGEKTRKNLEQIVSISTDLFKIFFSNRIVLSNKRKPLSKRVGNKAEFNFKGDSLFLYGLEKEEWFRLCLIYSQALDSLGWFHKGVCVLSRVCGSNIFFSDPRKKRLVLIMSLSAYISNGDLKRAVKTAGAFFRECTGSFRDCIFFFLITERRNIKRVLDSKTQRFLIRTASASINPFHLFMAGSVHVISSDYRSALSQYRRIGNPGPLLNLSLGVTNILLGIARKTKNKNKYFTDGFVFIFRYYEARRKSFPVEASYNVGRAFHQIGLYTKALEYYMNAFAESNGTERYLFECAYNSALIFKATGRKDVALCLIKKYCSI